MSGLRAYLIAGLVVGAACTGDAPSVTPPTPMVDNGMDAGAPPEVMPVPVDVEPMLPDAADMDTDAGLDAEAEVVETAPPAVEIDTSKYGICSEGQWCFELPFPVGTTINDAHRVSGDHVWFVGNGGLVLRHDGIGFEVFDSGTSEDLFAVWGAAEDDVWAAGRGSGVLHFDGDGWSEVPLLLEDGEPRPVARLFDLWGRAADDVWVAGHGGHIWHYDGTTWTQTPSGVSRILSAIWGTAPDNVYAVGTSGTMLHYDGTDWQRLPDVLGNLTGISGSSADDVWVAAAGSAYIFHFDGQNWQQLDKPSSVSLNDVWVQSDQVRWFLGDGGVLWRHHEETGFEVHSSGLSGNLLAFAPGDEDFWTVGTDGSVAHWEQGVRTVLSAGSKRNRLGFAMAASGDAWIVGDETLRFEGSKFVSVDRGTTRSLHAVSVVDADFAVAAGTGGTIVRWDGQTWSEMESGTTRWLRGAWGASSSSAWVVGDRGTILGLFNGNSWASSPAGTNDDLFAIWGAAADDAWAVGEAGRVLHWDGSDWQSVPSGVSVGLRVVKGRAADDVWAAGTLGTILHWDGQAWNVSADGASHSVLDVYARAADDVYAVGTGGTILHYDGSQWTPEVSGTDVVLSAVGMAPDGRLRAMGADGIVLVKRESDD